MAAKPLVSIIVPSFNQGRFIAETLRSCLEQDYRPIEVLVIDGASTDGTLEVLREIRAPELRWWSEPDRGVVDAVNRGLDRARGDILSIQSSDDLYLPGAVMAAVSALGHDPSLGLVYGDVELIDEHGQVLGSDVQGSFDLDTYLGRFQYIPQPGTFFSRAALETVGRWREEVSYAADADFWFRIATRLPVRRLDRLMGKYRYHPEQRDKQRQRIALDWERAVRDLMARDELGARTRRHARMGIYLARYRYASDGDWQARTRAVYCALLANPAGVFDPRFPRRDLFPGRDPVWRLLSRIKRKLGCRPRTS